MSYLCLCYSKTNAGSIGLKSVRYVVFSLVLNLKEREIDRQTNRQRQRQIDIQTDRHIYYITTNTYKDCTYFLHYFLFGIDI